MIPVEYGVRFRVFTDRSLGANRYGLLLSGSCDYSGGVRVIRQGGVEKLAEKAGLSFSWGTRYNPGANSFAWIYPWSDMLRVNLDIDGTELAVEGDEGFSVENGHGDVMVRLPLYYYSTEIDDEAGTLTFWVCQYKISDAYQPDPLHLRPDGTVNRGWEYIAAFYSRFDSSHNVNTGAAKSYTNAYSGDAGTQTKYTRYLQACCRRKGSGWRAFDWRAWAYIWRLNVIQNARLDYFGGHCRDNPWEASAYISSGTHLILAKYVFGAEDVLSPRTDRRIINGNNHGNAGANQMHPGNAANLNLRSQMAWQNITGLFHEASGYNALLIAGLWIHNGSYYLEMNPDEYVTEFPANCITADVPENFTRIGDAPANGAVPAAFDWTGEHAPIVLPFADGGNFGWFGRGTTDSRWYAATQEKAQPMSLRIASEYQTPHCSYLLWSPSTLDGPGTPTGQEITLISRDPAAGETITADQAVTYVLGATPEPRLYDESNANALIYSGASDGWGPGYSGTRTTDEAGHIVLTVRRDEDWLTGRCAIWIQADD